MSQTVEVVNLSTMATSIEFINARGEHDSATIRAKSRQKIDEESIVTSKEVLTKRGLVIRPLVTPASVSPPSSTTQTIGSNSGGKQKYNQPQNIPVQQPITPATDTPADNK